MSALLTTPQAAINIKNKEDGATPLHISIIAHKPNMAKALFEAGANPNIQEDATGQTALHLACHFEVSPEVAKMLISSEKADLNVKRKDGLTPIGVAVLTGNSRVVKLLLDSKKIDLDADRSTLLRMARAKGNKKVTSLLEKAYKEESSARLAAASKHEFSRVVGLGESSSKTPAATLLTTSPEVSLAPPVSAPILPSAVTESSYGLGVPRIGPVDMGVCPNNMIAANLQLLQLILGVCSKEMVPSPTTAPRMEDDVVSLDKISLALGVVDHNLPEITLHSREEQLLSDLEKREKLAKNARDSEVKQEFKRNKFKSPKSKSQGRS